MGNCFNGVNLKTEFSTATLQGDSDRAAELIETMPPKQAFSEITNLVRYFVHEEKTRDTLTSAIGQLSVQQRFQLCNYQVQSDPKGHNPYDMYEGSLLHNLLLAEDGLQLFDQLVEDFSPEQKASVMQLKNLHGTGIESLEKIRRSVELQGQQEGKLSKQDNWQLFNRMCQIPQVLDVLQANVQGEEWAEGIDWNAMADIYEKSGKAALFSIFSDNMIRAFKTGLIKFSDIKDLDAGKIQAIASPAILYLVESGVVTFDELKVLDVKQINAISLPNIMRLLKAGVVGIEDIKGFDAVKINALASPVVMELIATDQISFNELKVLDAEVIRAISSPNAMKLLEGGIVSISDLVEMEPVKIYALGVSNLRAEMDQIIDSQGIDLSENDFLSTLYNKVSSLESLLLAEPIDMDRIHNENQELNDFIESSAQDIKNSLIEKIVDMLKTLFEYMLDDDMTIKQASAVYNNKQENRLTAEKLDGKVGAKGTSFVERLQQSSRDMGSLSR